MRQPSRAWLRLAAFVMFLIAGMTSRGEAGRIVMAHDVNTLSTSLAGGGDELQFARNSALWLAGGAPGRLLAIESSATGETRDIAESVKTAWAEAGFDVDVVNSADFTLAQLQQYDAVYLGIIHGSWDVVDPAVLIDYVHGGGGVHVFGGVYSGQDAYRLNPFVTAFGLEYGDNNALFGQTVIDSNHPVFQGISALGEGNGNWITDLEPLNPANRILVSENGGGLYAVYETTVPEPGSLVLMLLAGGIGILARGSSGRRRNGSLLADR